MICPNFNDKTVKAEFDELVSAIGETAAYAVWSQNNGNAIDKAPNGASSELFTALLSHFNGDRVLAIQAKAKTFSNSFKTWFEGSVRVDENGEPEAVPIISFGNTPGGLSYVSSTERTSTPEAEKIMRVEDTPVIEEVASDKISLKDRVKIKLSPLAKLRNDILGKTPKIKNGNNDNAAKMMETLAEAGYDYQKAMLGHVQALANHFKKDLSKVNIIYQNYDEFLARYPEEGIVAYYDPNDNNIYVNKSVFDVWNPKHFYSTMLHEIVHAAVSEVFDHDAKLAEEVEKIYREYVKYYPDNKNDNNYASKSAEEFFSEILSNPYVLWNMSDIPSGNKTLKQRIVDFFKRLFGKVPSNTNVVEDLVNFMLDHSTESLFRIERAKGAPDYIPNKNRLYYRYEVKQEKKMEDIFANLRDVVDLKLKAFQRYAKLGPHMDSSEVAANKRLKIVFDRIIKNLGDDSAENITEYLDGILSFMGEVENNQAAAMSLLDQVETRLDKAIRDNNKAELKEVARILDNFGADYFEANKIMLMKFSDELRTEENQNVYQGILNAADPTGTTYAELMNMLEFLLMQYSYDYNPNDTTLGMKYSALQIKKAKHWMEGNMREAGDPSTENALRNFLVFSHDVHFLRRWVGTMSDTALPLKMIRNLMVKVEAKTTRALFDRFPRFKRIMDNITREEMLSMFETDENGKKTGFLARKAKQGLWANDIEKFRQKWIADNGFLTLDDIKSDAVKYSQFLKDYNDFKHQWVNRKFTKEYYDLYNALKPETVQALSEIDIEIETIAARFTDRTGTVRKDQMPSDVWEEYQALLEQKRNLANPYYYGDHELAGEPKSGVDLEIALDLTNLNNKLQEGLKKDRTNLDKFWAEYDRVVAEGGFNADGRPLDEVWLERNTHTVFTERFAAQLRAGERATYGPHYDYLYEKRSKYLNMYRTYDGQPDANRMPESIKEKIREVDEEMAFIRANTEKIPGSKKLFVVNSSEQFKARGGMQTAVPGVDYYIDPSSGKPQRYSYWNKVTPMRKSDVEKVPTNEWLETSVDSKYYNDQYDPTNPEAEQPIMEKNGVKTKYNNEEAYDKIMANPRLKEAYEAILEIMDEANNMITHTVYKNNYRLPQVMGSLWNYVQSKGVIRGIRQYHYDRMQINSNDVEYGVKPTTMPDGTEILMIPTQYMSMLADPGSGTNDLVGAIMDYYRMALNYKHKEEVKSDINIFRSLVKRKGTLEKRDEDGKIIQQTPADAANGLPNMIASMEALVKATVFGKSKMNKQVSIGKKTYSVDKLANSFAGYGRTLMLGWNPRSALSGSMAAYLFYLSEARAGAGINLKNFVTAHKRFFSEAIRFQHLRSLGGDTVGKSKIMALMERNGLTFSANESMRHTKRNRLGRMALKVLKPYMIWELASFLPNAVYQGAVYDNYRLVTNEDGTKSFMSEEDYVKYGHHPLSSMGDITDPVFAKRLEKAKRSYFNDIKETLDSAYDFKNGVLSVKPQYADQVTPTLENDIAAKMQYISSHAEGLASNVDRTGVYYYPFVSSILMFRAFMPKNIENATAQGHWNYEKKELSFGTMNAAFHQGAKLGVDYKILGILPSKVIRKLRMQTDEKVDKNREAFLNEYDGLTDEQLDRAIQSQVRRLNAQLIALVSMWILTLLTQSAIWDPDDDYLYLAESLQYGAFKTYLETSARYNPFELLNIINSLTPLAKTLEDIGNGALYLIPATAQTFGITNVSRKDKIKRGTYKGLTKEQRAVVKAVPILNAYWNMKDPGGKLAGLMNSLGK